MVIATNDLLAKELCAEGPDAQDMGNGLGIPTLREHSDGDNTANRSAQLAVLADGIHHLAEKRNVIEFFALLKFICELATAFQDVATEAVNLISGHCPEVVVQCFAGFKLLAVD